MGVPGVLKTSQKLITEPISRRTTKRPTACALFLSSECLLEGDLLVSIMQEQGARELSTERANALAASMALSCLRFFEAARCRACAARFEAARDLKCLPPGFRIVKIGDSQTRTFQFFFYEAAI